MASLVASHSGLGMADLSVFNQAPPTSATVLCTVRASNDAQKYVSDCQTAHSAIQYCECEQLFEEFAPRASQMCFRGRPSIGRALEAHLFLNRVFA